MFSSWGLCTCVFNPLLCCHCRPWCLVYHHWPVATNHGIPLSPGYTHHVFYTCNHNAIILCHICAKILWRSTHHWIRLRAALLHSSYFLGGSVAQDDWIFLYSINLILRIGTHKRYILCSGKSWLVLTIIQSEFCNFESEEDWKYILNGWLLTYMLWTVHKQKRMKAYFKQ